MFRKKTTVSLVFALVVVNSVRSADMAPVPLTGFNLDLVVESAASGPPYSDVASALYGSENRAFYQAGLTNKNYGLPASGSFISEMGDGTVFQFASYSNNNALVLNSFTGLSSGTLNLVSPQVFSRIAILAHSSSGGSMAPVTLNFSDGTTLETTYNALDWFNNSDFALSGVERIDLTSGTTQGAPSNPRFYQTTIDISAALGATNKPLTSLTFQKADAGSTGIYAVSGELAPGIAPFFSLAPTNVAVIENSSVVFYASAGGNPVPAIQWYRGGNLIPGASGSAYTLAAASLADHNAQFRAVASNFVGGMSLTATSATAQLSVSADTVRPVFARARCLGLEQVELLFSEPVAPSTATNKANYVVSGTSGSIGIISATVADLQSNVVLRVASLVEGAAYNVTVSGVTDRAQAANQVLPGSQLSFVASPWVPEDIGAALPFGGVERVSGGVNVTGGGSQIGGTSDQCQFSYQLQTGDFDVRVRLDGLTLTDPWAEAGLMARETTAGGSRFASVLATPSISGSFFKYRPAANGTVVRTGNFPVNYPATWLRLRRVGDQFTGFAGRDGSQWTQLGSISLTLPSNIYLGYVVSSHDTNEAAVARFREFGNVTNVVAATGIVDREPLGQSSRRTPLVISEIMYHPPDLLIGPRPAELEFVEICNTRGEPEDISGFRISGDVDYVFPDNTILPGGGFLVVARAPSDLQQVYGYSGALGPWVGASTNGLSNSSGNVQLRHRTGAVLLEVPYETESPWPLEADGAGHSLVLARASYGERNPQAWAPSDRVLGSPGQMDPVTPDPLDDVVINEFLAHTDDPELDYIELYNHSNLEVDLSGSVLTDDRDVNKFLVPAGTRIPPRGFIQFTQTTLGFALNAAGEVLYFKNPANDRVLDSLSFGGQENGVATGRWPDGADDFYRLATKTPGTNNAAIKPANVVINELMYHPISNDDDDQYIELHNTGSSPADLSGWRLADGVNYVFPSNTVLAANGYLVVARSAARLRANNPQLNAANCLGDFSGRLAGGGERVALMMPDTVVSQNNGVWETNLIYISMDEVTYADGGKWGRWSDGDGSSLELIDPRSNRRLPSNWADSDETTKASWSLIEVQGTIDNGNNSPDQLQVLLQGPGECLIDNVEVLDAQGVNQIANSTFESSADGWVAQGTESQSGWETSQGYLSSRSYRIRAVGRGDNQVNRVRVPLATPLTSGSVATIRARVRWLKGHPELVLRLRGNWLEAAGRMQLPANLGTPGQPNSRRVSNSPPAIYDVAHAPVLPAANEPVVVTARVDDPDNVGAITLYFRYDPSTSYAALTMRDDGTSGDAIAADRIFTVTLPGAAAGTQIAYYLQAIDQAASPATARFPSDAPVRECLVRYGENVPTGNFPVYRLWMTKATFDTWTARTKLDNTPNSVTFVLGGQRAIHCAEAQFAGSPYIAPGFNTPSGARCGYSIEVPKDDLFLGGTDLVLDWPGGHGGEYTALQEQMAYWIADRLDLPFSYRYHIRLMVNGVTDMQRGGVFEAILQPAGDFIEQWSYGDSDGDFYKIDRAFEFNDGGGLIADPMPRLESYVTPDLVNGGTKKKIERYRWTWLKRSSDSVLDYTNIFALVDALNASSPQPYTAQTEGLVDLPEFMGMFAFEHIINNFDSWGHDIGKNMYMYKPASGPWQLYAFDLDWLMLVSVRNGYTASGGPLFSSNDPTVTRMYNHPPFRRAYLQAVQKAVDGPLLAANCDPVMDAKYASLVANGITACDGGALVSPTEVKSWFQQRRSALVTQLAQYAASFSVSGSANRTVTSNLVTLSGTAPLAMESLVINGLPRKLTWTSVTAWTLQLPVSPGTTSLNVVAYDRNGTQLSAAQINVTYNGGMQAPEGRLVINEIAVNPPSPNAEFVELFNTSTNAFDLSGWVFNGLDYTFPPGSFIGGNSYMVLAKDRVAFNSAFGVGRVAFDVFPGGLQADGETLTLTRPPSNSVPGAAVSKVRYEGTLPWAPAIAASSSLQLMDPQQDTWRAGNWAVVQTNAYAQPQWLFVTTNITATSSSLYLYLGSAGDIYLDDVKLVRNSTDVVVNGGFESSLAGSWTISADFAQSHLSTAVRRNGNSSLHLVATAPGAGGGDSVSQVLALTTGQTYTLSFWYLQSTNGGPLTVRLGSSTTPAVVNPAPVTQANWARYTPGYVNAVSGSMAAFPQLWINELQTSNTTGITNSLGQRVPWIEIYNPTASPISLNGLFLSTNYGRLDLWPFPSGATVNPGQFKVVFADGQTNLTTATEWHTSFVLPGATAGLALTRLSTNAQMQVLDYVNFGNVGINRSFGSFPDGQSFDRQEFYYVTPGAPNNATNAPLTVYLNEWVADNTAVLADPSDGQFEDWFEIHNPTDQLMDLGGFYLTDNLSDPFQYQVPANGQYRIPPHGFLLVWADDEAAQNTPSTPDLHVSFKLGKEGDAIGLFASDGTCIDSVEFGAQSSNVSEGRYPDANSFVLAMTTPSPRAPNILPPAAEPPNLTTFTVVGGQVTIVFQTSPGHTYQVEYTDSLSSPSWLPLTGYMFATGSELTVNEAVPGVAQRFYRVLQLD